MRTDHDCGCRPYEEGQEGEVGGLFFAEAAVAVKGDPVHGAVGRFAGGGA